MTQTQSQEKENLNCKQHTLEKCGHFTNVESDLQSVFTFSHAACNNMMDTPKTSLYLLDSAVDWAELGDICS